MPDDTLDTWLEAAHAAADAAAAVVRPFFRAGLQTITKADRSPVTLADRTAEQVMRAVLAERLPGHAILGEEYGETNPGARHRWVLDPIDGTRAFITGRPTFGTLIALLDDGVPILGLIDQPVSHERWVGAKDGTQFQSQFLGAHGRIGTRACPSLADAELSCTAPEIFTAEDAPRLARLQAATRRTTWGGDCYAYGLLALGCIDVIVESTLQIWDWAALVPVVEGAGGRMTGWDGAPLGPKSDGRVIAVGNPALLPEIVALMKDPA